MSNFLKPLYTAFDNAVEKITSNNSYPQQVSSPLSGITLIYTFYQFEITCDVVFNNFQGGQNITINLDNFSSNVAIADMEFYPCNNIQIIDISTKSLIINTDNLIKMNGILKLKGY